MGSYWSWITYLVQDCPGDAWKLLCTYPRTFASIGLMLALIAIDVGRRFIRKLERHHHQHNHPYQAPCITCRSVSLPGHLQNFRPPGSPGAAIASPRLGRTGGGEGEGGSERAYGDELLHDRRLRHRYRKLKQNVLHSGQSLFSKIRKPKDRDSRQLEDGLGSIYSPMDMPKPTAYSRQVSTDVTLEGVRLDGDGYAAFMSIMTQWKVFGGRDVPLLSKLCRGIQLVEMKAGQYLFQEGKPLEKCLHILKSGELEISVKSESGESADLLELINQDGTIVSGILDLVALLTESQVAEHCASAKCVKDCEILQIPVNPQDEALQSTDAQARCRLIRSCLIRSYRVTLLTAYAYLGVIYDVYPRHPIFPVTGSHLSKLQQDTVLTERHQSALKRLIRMVLALDQDYEVPDLECLLPSPSTPRSRSTPTTRSNNYRSSTPTNTTTSNRSNTNGSSSTSPSPRAPATLREGVGKGSGSSGSTTSSNSSNDQPAPLSPTNSTPSSSGIPRLYYLRKGESPHELDDNSRSSMHILVTGRLLVTREKTGHAMMGKTIFAEATDHEDEMGPHARAEHGPGAVVGYSLLLMGTPENWYMDQGKRKALLKMTASCDSWIIQIPQPFIDQAMKRDSYATLALAARKILETIPKVLRLIDFGVKWKQLGAGDVLVTEGQPSDGCLYVLLYGRARSAITENGRSIVVADHGRGTLIGETEILTGGTHKATVQAVRYTSFATIPSSVLSLLVRRHPRVLANLAEHVVEKAQHCSTIEANKLKAGSRAVVGEQSSKTILVLPVSPSVPLDHFCKTLEAAMVKARHSVRVVTSELAASILGLEEEGISSECIDVLLLESWLTQQEEQHEIVLYQADWQNSEWNRLASAMADVVLLVANANDKPQISYLEQQLDAVIRNAQKFLVMLHINPNPYYTPSGTRLWINKRHGINQHYHVRVHMQSVQFDQQHIRSDFSRLCRILTGTAVGLVLGGGGARGLAHLGVLRVLEEEGIPIDHIVGVSIGAFIGGLYAKHGSYLEILPFATRFASTMSSAWLFLKDFTLPFTSYFNGYSFGRELEKAFGDTKIEDCWLSFGCVTVDLSVSAERVHQNGTLWRYVRASMTLAGFLPPLCDVDPKDDAVHYLVDGGYVNNLPGDVMKDLFGAETIIACDISVDVVLTGREDYGDTLYGQQILWQFLAWSKSLKAPSMGEISSQLMYVRSVEQLERVKAVIDCHLKPPVGGVNIMDWKRHAEVQSLGYNYARDAVKEWREAQKKEKGARPVVRVGMTTELEMRRGMSLSALDELALVGNAGGGGVPGKSNTEYVGR